MTDYFIIRKVVPPETVPGYMDIEDWVDIEGFERWGDGSLASQNPNGQVEIAAVPHEGYTGPPDDLSDGTIPLMSARLRKAIEAAGVDNLRFYQVTLRNPETGSAYEYHAFNLVGLVSAADLSRSNITSEDGDFVGDSQIRDLVLDESQCHGLMMFRLKEKFSAILVHRRVKESIESHGIDTVTFVKPEDFMLL